MDELCRKHGLSSIENPHLSKGKSHWEWKLEKQDMSWKEQLKRTIDEFIKVSKDFADFLAKCAEYGILVDYNPDHKIDFADGKTLPLKRKALYFIPPALQKHIPLPAAFSSQTFPREQVLSLPYHR